MTCTLQPVAIEIRFADLREGDTKKTSTPSAFQVFLVDKRVEISNQRLVRDMEIILELNDIISIIE